MLVSVLRLCVFSLPPSRLPNAASPFSAFVVDFPQNGSDAARCVSNCPKEKQAYCCLSLSLFTFLSENGNLEITDLEKHNKEE